MLLLPVSNENRKFVIFDHIINKTFLKKPGYRRPAKCATHHERIFFVPNPRCKKIFRIEMELHDGKIRKMPGYQFFNILNIRDVIFKFPF